MIKLSELQVDIYEILKEKPITRTDDQLLYIAYWSKKRPDVPFGFQFVSSTLQG